MHVRPVRKIGVRKRHERAMSSLIISLSRRCLLRALLLGYEPKSLLETAYFRFKYRDDICFDNAYCNWHSRIIQGLHFLNNAYIIQMFVQYIAKRFVLLAKSQSSSKLLLIFWIMSPSVGVLCLTPLGPTFILYNT